MMQAQVHLKLQVSPVRSSKISALYFIDFKIVISKHCKADIFMFSFGLYMIGTGVLKYAERLVYCIATSVF